MPRILKYFLITAETLLLSWLVATESLAPIGWIALGILSAALLLTMASVRWPLGALLLLTICSAMPRFAVVVLGLHLRAEHLAILAVTCLFAGRTLSVRRLPNFRLRKFDYALIAYIALNFITSALTSPEPRLTLRWAVLNAIVIGPYFLIRLLVTDEEKLHRAFHILLGVGAAEAAYGIFCFFSNHLLHTSFGLETEQYGSIPGTYGTQYEANLFGSYTGACAIMFFACFLMGRESSRGKYRLGLAVTILGAIVSLARSVYLAFPIALLFVLWIAFKKRQFQLKRLIPLAVGAGLTLAVLSPFMLGFVRERFSTINPTELASDPTALTRIVQMAVAAEDVRAHPLLGTGTASFQLFFDWDDYIPEMKGTEDQGGGWVGNTPLRILHDTGLIGLVVFLLFLAWLGSAVYKAGKLGSPPIKIILIALSSGLFLFAITFQATEATILAFTWVHFGLLAAAVAVTKSSTTASETVFSR